MFGCFSISSNLLTSERQQHYHAYHYKKDVIQKITLMMRPFKVVGSIYILIFIEWGLTFQLLIRFLKMEYPNSGRCECNNYNVDTFMTSNGN